MTTSTHVPNVTLNDGGEMPILGLLSAIGDAHGKSVAQVVLRWLIQREVVAIPKSVHRERMEQNFDVFDFALTDEEMGRIAAMDTGASLFFDHRDPAMVSWLNSVRDS